MNELFNKNLELIATYNKELVEKVLNHQEISKPTQLVNALSGDTNLLYDNKYVHDNVDPTYEAIEICHNLIANKGNKKVCLLYGLGLGYLLKRFSQKYEGRIIIIEPNLDILRIVLEVVDFSEDFSKQNIKIASNDKEIQACTSAFSVNYSDEMVLSYLPFYQNAYQDHILALENALKKINKQSDIWTTPCKINVGPGAWEKEGWITLDCYIEADIQVDLRKFTPLPLADNIIEKAFSSHCIEHIEDPHLEFLLKELYRTLKPGATLRLACPDADKALNAYKNNDRSWFSGIITKKEDGIGALLLNTFVSYEAGSGGPQVPEEEVRGKFESLNKEDFIKWCLSLCDRTRPYIAHINGIYYEKLEKMLKNAGFVNIEKSSFKNSKDEELRGPKFDQHQLASLFVECQKP